MPVWTDATARRRDSANDGDSRAVAEKGPAHARAELRRRPPAAFGLPASAPADVFAGLKQVLDIERDIRAAWDRETLVRCATHHLRDLVAARQALFMRYADGKARTVFVAGASKTVNAASAVARLKAGVDRLAMEAQTATTWSLHDFADSSDSTAPSIPFPFVLWAPVRFQANRPSGGFLLLREAPWSDGDVALAGRVADMVAHADRALESLEPRPSGGAGKAVLVAALAVLIGSAAFLPVTVRVTASGVTHFAGAQPARAPFDGMVAETLVAPGQAVAAGDIVARLDDGPLHARLSAAERAAAAAEAELHQALRAALVDPSASAGIVAARLRLAERRAAREAAGLALATAVVRAPSAGLAHFGETRGIVGRTVAAGAEVLTIVEPGRVELRLVVPAAQADKAKTGARIKVRLADDPAEERVARIVAVTPPAGDTPPGVHAVTARFEDGLGAPRVGVAASADLAAERQTLGRLVVDLLAGWLPARLRG